MLDDTASVAMAFEDPAASAGRVFRFALVLDLDLARVEPEETVPLEVPPRFFLLKLNLLP